MELVGLYLTRHALERFLLRAPEAGRSTAPDLTLWRLLAGSKPIRWLNGRGVRNAMKYGPAQHRLAATGRLVLVVGEGSPRPLITVYPLPENFRQGRDWQFAREEG